MTDSVSVAGEELISSKRASKETGYTQDYVGQLARGGFVTAKRIGGHWYVSGSSLRAYKAKAEEYKPQPPPFVGDATEIESSVSFDGKDFISASRAAKLTGYHQDYVGQLARSGKIASRQIGNRWFVDRDILLDHKSEKDSLLGAVQSQSVGLNIHTKSAPTPGGVGIPTHPANEPDGVGQPFFSYTQQESDLMPAVTNKTPSSHAAYSGASYSEHSTLSGSHHAPTPLQIRRINTSHTLQSPQRGVAEHKKPRKSFLLPFAGAALTIVVVFTFGFTSLKDRALYALGELRTSTIGQTASAGGFSKAMLGAIEKMEELFSHELYYTAARK